LEGGRGLLDQKKVDPEKKKVKAWRKALVQEP
jgi:hypothetical protein